MPDLRADALARKFFSWMFGLARIAPRGLKQQQH
jgi:hypothetical protein